MPDGGGVCRTEGNGDGETHRPFDGPGSGVGGAEGEGVGEEEGVGACMGANLAGKRCALMMQNAGFEMLAVEKVEYEWTTEFADPPQWLGEPYPWDWLLVCRKA